MIIIHIVDILENDKKELCVIGYGIGNGVTYFSLQLTSNGDLMKPYQKLFSGEDTIDSFAYAADKSLYLCGLKKTNGSASSSGYLSKYSPDGALIFTKTFEVSESNSYARYMELVLMPDGNILVRGGFVRANSGKGFDNLGVKLPVGKSSNGTIIVKYSPDGKILGGDIIINKNEEGFDSGKRLINLDNGDALLYYTAPGNFIDPVSGTVVQSKQKQALCYRINTEGKLSYLYNITSELFFGVYNGVHSIKRLNDGAFRVISAENSDFSRLRIFDVPDKFHLQKVIDSTVNLKEDQYSTRTWSVFTQKLYSANQINVKSNTSQVAVNIATDELKTAINNLKGKDTESSAAKPPATKPPATNSPAAKSPTTKSSATNSPVAKSSATNSPVAENTENNSSVMESVSGSYATESSSVEHSDVNANDLKERPQNGNLFLWISIGVILLGAAGGGAYLLIRKKRHL